MVLKIFKQMMGKKKRKEIKLQVRREREFSAVPPLLA